VVAHSYFTRSSNSQATRARKIAVCDRGFITFDLLMWKRKITVEVSLDMFT